MFKLVPKIIGLVLMIAVLGYVSVCAITSYKGCEPIMEKDYPAEYSFKIKVTGSTVFTNDYDVNYLDEDKVYTLHGYYENIDGKFKYKDIDLILDERYFGVIEVRKME